MHSGSAAEALEALEALDLTLLLRSNRSKHLADQNGFGIGQERLAVALKRAGPPKGPVRRR
jgi:hypothetical protein